MAVTGALDFSDFLESTELANFDNRFVGLGGGNVGGLDTPALSPFRGAASPVAAASPQGGGFASQVAGAPAVGPPLQAGDGQGQADGFAAEDAAPGFGPADALGIMMGFTNPFGMIASIANAVANQVNQTPQKSIASNVLGLLGVGSTPDQGGFGPSGFGGFGPEAMGVAASQSDAQAAENDAQGGVGDGGGGAAGAAGGGVGGGPGGENETGGIGGF